MITPTWADPRRGGAGTWRHTAPHAPSLRFSPVAFLACLIGLTLFIGLVAVGRAGMCDWYDNQLQYCSGYATETPR